MVTLGRRLPIALLSLALLAVVAGMVAAQNDTDARRKAWNAEQPPFKIYGNTYYVGPHGLSSLLITSNQGHVLIDGGLPESAPLIAANIRTLGFKVEDVKVILNSHVHDDHAGGIAELQRLSGATVAASESSAKVLKSNTDGRDDPQFGSLPPPTTAAIAKVKVVKDGETLKVGPLALTARYTPGHTPGGTSWSWQSCEGAGTNARCMNIVYADSLTAISADGFLFTKTKENPHAVQDFDKSFATLRALTCDILLTPHPEVSDLWGRIEKRDKGGVADALIDRAALGRFVDKSRENAQKRFAEEREREKSAKPTK
jgi:metallo-beta-lactamase class B